jgi:hypothetical protein
LADAAEKAPALADEVSLTVDEARALLATLEGSTDELETILGNLEEIDLLALRRLVREDGVLVRLKPAKIEEE